MKNFLLACLLGWTHLKDDVGQCLWPSPAGDRRVSNGKPHCPRPDSEYLRTQAMSGSHRQAPDQIVHFFKTQAMSDSHSYLLKIRPHTDTMHGAVDHLAEKAALDKAAFAINCTMPVFRFTAYNL